MLVCCFLFLTLFFFLAANIADSFTPEVSVHMLRETFLIALVLINFAFLLYSK